MLETIIGSLIFGSVFFFFFSASLFDR